MIRTQIQLPDELYARAKRLAEAREMSLAELARRGIESLLSQYPIPEEVPQSWEVPVAKVGGLKVPLEELRTQSAAEEESRGLDEGRD